MKQDEFQRTLQNKNFTREEVCSLVNHIVHRVNGAIAVQLAFFEECNLQEISKEAMECFDLSAMATEKLRVFISELRSFLE